MWWGAWGVLLPAIQRSSGVDDGELGVALLFVGVGALASMRLAGALIDRWGGIVLPLTVAVFAACGIPPAAAEGMVQLAVAMLVLGAASGAMDVAVNTAGAHHEAATGSSVMNLAHGLFSVGVIGSAAATGVLRSLDAGPTGILILLATVLWGAALWLGIRHRAPASEPALSPARERPWRRFRPPRRLVVIGALTALGFLVENAWQSWSALHLERDLAAGPGVSALGPVVFGASAATGRLAAHRIGQRFREQDLVRYGAVLAGTGTVLAAAAPVVPLAVAGIVGAGLGTAVCAPSLLSLAGRGTTERHRGASMGTVTTLAYLGFVIAPAFVGILADLTSLPLALGAVALAAAALAAGAGRARPAGPGGPGGG